MKVRCKFGLALCPSNDGINGWAGKPLMVWGNGYIPQAVSWISEALQYNFIVFYHDEVFLCKYCYTVVVTKLSNGEEQGTV